MGLILSGNQIMELIKHPIHGFFFSGAGKSGIPCLNHIVRETQYQAKTFRQQQFILAGIETIRMYIDHR